MPLHHTDLIFPSQSVPIHQSVSSLSRSRFSITNHLHSIDRDSRFVCRVADVLDLPLIANERCGSWYVPTQRKKGSVYFKSTDGHWGQWKFSLRRLNLGILDIVGEADGMFFPEDHKSHQLRTPSQVISRSEHSQIEAKIRQFVSSFIELNVDLHAVRSKISKPLLPVWITQDDKSLSTLQRDSQYHTVVLCTSSCSVIGGEDTDQGYIQGAGDDSENWAHSLTPALLWEHKDVLLSASEDDLPSIIAKLTSQDQHSASDRQMRPVAPTSQIFISEIASTSKPLLQGNTQAIITCGPSPQDDLEERLKSRYLHIKCGLGKQGSRDLRSELSKVRDFLPQIAAENVHDLIVCCETGKDFAAGVALAVLCLCAHDDGRVDFKDLGTQVNKTVVRQRLSWIVISYPDINPPRATVQAVKAFLMNGKYESS
ncbi:tRNA a64-2'-o-ribosylphosphate transferase [Viridothelium virens]|uniref:tRNA a64-2'-o-ribosylphosphate transferase n=1 Tax=Viridothelium virens TaxID=1048519 RepID=A0A6A6HKR2_VIRVR|nr:tRNA a64-2'-o-ribosylphosphate transferase [Viridothelium virens]